MLAPSLQKLFVTWLLLLINSIVKAYFNISFPVFIRKDCEKTTCKDLNVVIIGADLQQKTSRRLRLISGFQALMSLSEPGAQSGFLGSSWLIN